MPKKKGKDKKSNKTIVDESNKMTNIKNKKIVEEFEKLIKQIKYDIDQTTDKKKRKIDSYRLQSIMRAYDIIRHFPDEIKSSEQLKNIPGIGKGSMERIDEILKSGKLEEISDNILDKKYLDYIDELSEIHGIGKARAMQLYKDYNVKSIEDLKKLHEEGKITLPENNILGLKYYDDIKQPIPRSEIDLVDEYLHKVLLKIDPELFGVICGSYRRLKETSGDIDVLIVHPQIVTIDERDKSNYLILFINALIKDGFIVDSLTSDDVTTKYMGFCRLKKNSIVRRIDIRFFPYKSYYTALLYFTGSKDFNKKMRLTAISMGYKLNEYGLYDQNGKAFKITSEKDVFDLLGMEYLPPEKR